MKTMVLVGSMVIRGHFGLKRRSADVETQTRRRPVEIGAGKVAESKLVELLRKQRRRVERVRVQWDGLYGLGGEPSLRCRVLDVSIAGARLELVEDPGGQLDFIVVELRAPKHEGSGPTLQAEVRSIASNNGPRTVGIEFFNTTNRARLMLAELITRYA